MNTLIFRLLVAAACLTGSAKTAPAQESGTPGAGGDASITAGGQSDEEAVHDELRALRDGLVESVNKSDLDGLVSHLHENVVVVWLDGTESRGHDAVRKYYQDKTEGDDAIVKSFSVKPEVKELSFLYGDDTAVAYGTAVSHFELTNGMSLDVPGPWSATMVKEDGRWLIASFHSSIDMFDNPLLNAATRAIYWTGGIAAAVGLLVGLVVMGFIRKRRAPAN